MEERPGTSPSWPTAGQQRWEPWPQPPHTPPWGRRHRPPWGRRRWRGRGPLRRATGDRMAGGVAAGLAARFGLSVTLVRTVFVLATLASGIGAAAYVVGWLLIPADGEDGNIAGKALADRRGVALATATGSLLIVLLLIASAVGAGWLGSYSWPLVVSAAGLVLLWRNAPPDEQAVIRRVAEPLAGLTGGAGRLRFVLRLVLGALLLAGGVAALLSGHPTRHALVPLGGVLLVVAAIVVVLGPWWLNIARDLVLERQARARAEERADMAARVHDSVLQTLALIQLKAGNSQQVVQLARAQERELRSWLFGGAAPGSLGDEATTLAAGVRLIQQEVEAQHGVSVEAVTVGDCPLDDDLRALLAAAREATVNAVKWSGAGVVSLFAEVETAEVSLFVRDRGRGFDPAAVPGDRKGVSESIRGRMARHGGSASIRSVLGEGTEVTLRMPRGSGERLAGRA